MDIKEFTNNFNYKLILEQEQNLKKIKEYISYTENAIMYFKGFFQPNNTLDKSTCENITHKNKNELEGGLWK